jgi:dynein heavy chain
MLYQHKNPIFITGTSGTGKSIHLNRLPCVPLMLTSTTSPYQLQLAIESKLEKIKKNLLGGKPGEICIVAIDDTNMPDIEEYGAMPPVEVIRTIVDKGGVWDRKERFWKHIENTVMVCACSSPGAGRNPLPPRLTRHFNMLCLPEPNELTLSRIYKSIL